MLWMCLKLHRSLAVYISSQKTYNRSESGKLPKCHSESQNWHPVCLHLVSDGAPQGPEFNDHPSSGHKTLSLTLFSFRWPASLFIDRFCGPVDWMLISSPHSSPRYTMSNIFENWRSSWDSSWRGPFWTTGPILTCPFSANLGFFCLRSKMLPETGKLWKTYYSHHLTFISRPWP